MFDNIGVKYFIHLCQAGEGGNGGFMELNGKNVVSITKSIHLFSNISIFIPLYNMYII